MRSATAVIAVAFAAVLHARDYTWVMCEAVSSSSNHKDHKEHKD